jgi:phage tail protein X
LTNVYTTVQGDTWDIIAYKNYKDETYMTTLIEANLAHREVVIFSAGVLLELPDAVTEKSADLPPWRTGDEV